MYYISIIKNEKQSNKYLFTYHPEQKIKHYQNSWSPTCTTPKHSFLSLHNPYPTLEVYHFRALTFFDNVYILEQYRQLFVMFLNKWYHTCTFPWASNWGKKISILNVWNKQTKDIADGYKVTYSLDWKGKIVTN